MTSIADYLHVDRRLLLFMIQSEPVLFRSYNEWKIQNEQNHLQKIEECVKASSRCYDYDVIEGEEWRSILGFDDYEISNYGRVRRLAKRYKRFYILKQCANKNTGRLYVRLTNKDGKSKNLQVANIVAHTFVDGCDSEHNTVNHIDGNIQNNTASNLEWVSQSENNFHSYRKLNRKKVGLKDRRYIFHRILYRDKYEFKTVAALARFLHKSETQVRRYLDNPEKHDLKLVV